VKGAKGTLTLSIKSGIKVVQKDKHLEVEADTSAGRHERNRRCHACPPGEHGHGR